MIVSRILPEIAIRDDNRLRFPIATRLVFSFLLVIFLTSAVFSIVGIRIINNRIVSEAQEKVRFDLNAAREIYLGKLAYINDVVRFTADKFLLKEALLSGNMEKATGELVKVKAREKLDVLAITDSSGNVLFRSSNISLAGDNQVHDSLVALVLSRRVPVAATTIISAEDLKIESPLFANRAQINFVDTPKARLREETNETSGMMLKAAAPMFDSENRLIGVVYGGILLNRNYEIVDRVKQTVFQDMKYAGKDIGTATIFQDDVRISTNVYNEDNSRAIGTRIQEDVYNQVVIQGQPWIGRAYVVNDWYITAYEPIRDINDRIVGILYVGILEEKYLDIRRETILAYLSITLIVAIASVLLSYLISSRISIPIQKLASASREIAQGNLDTKVAISSHDELGELANAFNMMTSALKERDEKLKEFTRTKIMESERLALIGQLSANVAHELNNPLQGIVTYSHLLLEKTPTGDNTAQSLQKIATQANRCREIIRGLLDFSRQRKPDKILTNINSVLQECISLIENQSLFHNIQIVQEYDPDLPLVVIDPSQIERVFINMIVNAAEAMEGNGQLMVTTRFEPGEQFIEIDFADSGHGIKKENLDKIFDPFFTTKETGHGVGLGLAISYGIVKEHHGTISVESEIGKGTTFLIRLPITVMEKVANNGR
jgi:two-component system, NtrC family, sensor kinase